MQQTTLADTILRYVHWSAWTRAAETPVHLGRQLSYLTNMSFWDACQTLLVTRSFQLLETLTTSGTLYKLKMSAGAIARPALAAR